jgi:hypothetical protein
LHFVVYNLAENNRPFIDRNGCAEHGIAPALSRRNFRFHEHVLRALDDLLGTPALVGLAHVRRRLDGGDEFQDGIRNAEETDDGTGNILQNVAMQDETSNEDVDFIAVSAHGPRATQLLGR